MATYVNNLRLTELATGEGSGTWGATTNTNLELIGEALGYGSEAVANASTHTITVADGTADSARSFYLKLTGGGQACTVTLAPNTLSKVWMVENTTNSTLTFTQGSGANVAIAAGAVKMIATDGAGSGAVVYDLLVDTDLTGTTTVVNLTSSGTIDAATVEFNSLSGTGSVAITDILDQDDMSSNSATALATQQSIKAYVDSSVASFDTLAEVLAQGNTTGGTDIVMSAGDNITNASGDLTIDVAGDIILDAGGSNVFFKKAGTSFYSVNEVNGNAYVGTAQSDKDLYIRGNDGGTDITALLFDMSAAGAATFNSSVTVASTLFLAPEGSNDLIRSTGGVFYLKSNSLSVQNNSGVEFIGTSSAGTIFNNGSADLDFRVESNSQTHMLFVDGGTNRVGIGGVVVPSDVLQVHSGAAGRSIFRHASGDGGVTITGSGSGSAASLIFGNNWDNDAGSNFVEEYRLFMDGADDSLKFKYNANQNTALTLSNAGAATFNSSVTATSLDISGDIDVDGVTNLDVVDIDGAVDMASTLNVSGNLTVGSNIIASTFTVDAGGDINLDANGGDIILLDNGTGFGRFTNSSTDFVIKSDFQDKDMKFQGNDGGVGINALILDMSEAGAATFNAGATFGSTVLASNASSINIVLRGGDGNSKNITFQKATGAAEQAKINAIGDDLTIYTGPTSVERASFNSSEAVFNDSSTDTDFRVESDTNTHALFVEGSGNNVGIGTSTLTSSSGYHTLSLNGSTGGQLSFQTGGSGKHFIYSTATDLNMYSTADGALRFSTNNLERLEMTSSSTIFNDIGADVDFRVESDANTHALFVDAGNSRVGINQTAPKGELHVTGGADSLIFIDGTTSVANSPTTLFTINLPGVANAVFVTLFVRGIANGIAWFGFKQDFVAARGGSILATAGQVVETAGGGTMTLNVSGSNLNVQFNHASSAANTMNWSAVIQGNPGDIS